MSVSDMPSSTVIVIQNGLGGHFLSYDKCLAEVTFSSVRGNLPRRRRPDVRAHKQTGTIIACAYRASVVK